MNTDTLSYLKTTTGRPSAQMTNQEWQELFKLLKITTTPSKQKSISTCKLQSIKDSYSNTYCGDTLDQNWRRVLNDNLKQIRSGEVDYVYFVYNIVELLKYEHERLRSNYCPSGQYFSIWLDN